MWIALMTYLIFGEMLMILGLSLPGSHLDKLRGTSLRLMFPACMICLFIWPLYVYRGFKR